MFLHNLSFGIETQLCLNFVSCYNSKVGTLAFNLIILRVMSFGEECIYREYRDMEHGWTVRGDNRREDVNNAARAAFTSLLGFFSTHLK